MSAANQSAKKSYAAFVQSLAKSSPSYHHLSNFLGPKQRSLQSTAQFTVATIKFDNVSLPEFNLESFTGVHNLSSELQKHIPESLCRLFLVENVCAESICVLGEQFDIDPQFFADHLNNEPWYRIENVAKRIPALPSRQKLHDHLQLRFIETLAILENHIMESTEEIELIEDLENQASRPSSEARSFMHPETGTTNIPRKAGKLVPRERKGKKYKTLLCARQTVTVWFQETKAPRKGWTGIILLDPPFSPADSGTKVRQTGYRSFRKRASLANDNKQFPLPLSTREALAQHLTERCSSNPSFMKEAISDCFVVLGDLYRIIASNWVVINEYVNREMATIEYILEKEEPGFRDLEIYLKDLYIFRRRCTKYYELITQGWDQCRVRGQQSWPHHQTSSAASQDASDMEGDFAFLQVMAQQTTQRIEKNINLLTTLVAIGAGKQGLDENHGIARLTLLATVFLPFSTVATMLSMQGNYAPGGDTFWLFWVVAVPITLFILAISMLYDGFGLSLLGSLMQKIR